MQSLVGAFGAQFLILSSPTFALPSVMSAIIISGVVIGGLYYAFTSYGLTEEAAGKHVIAGVTASVLVAVFLAIMWGQLSISQILNVNFLTTVQFTALLASLPVASIFDSLHR